MSIERVHIRLIAHPIANRGLFPLDHFYVEDYWMSAVGPTAVAMLRHVGQRVSTYGDPGVTMDVEELSTVFGLGTGNGRWCPLLKTLDRLCHFGTGRWDIPLTEAESLAAVSIYDRVDVVPLSQVNRWRPLRRAEHRAIVAAHLEGILR